MSDAAGRLGAMRPLSPAGLKDTAAGVRTSPLLDVPPPDEGLARSGETLVGRYRRHPGVHHYPHLAVAAGLDERDLSTLVHQAAVGDGRVWPVDEPTYQTLARYRLHDLVQTGHSVPGISLRAAVGWWLLSIQDGHNSGWLLDGLMPPSLVLWLTGLPVGTPRPAALTAWQDQTRWLGFNNPENPPVRLGERGWALAAAGLTRAEAEALVLEGGLDWVQVETIAALRGMPAVHTR